MRRTLQVSRVLKLPIPAKSTQLLGKEAVGDEGRGANLIDIGNGTVVVSAASLHGGNVLITAQDLQPKLA